MPRVRAELKKSKYKLPKHRFYTAYHHALQYNEWKDELNTLSGLKAINMDGMPHGTTVGNPTELLGIRRAELSEKMALVERVCSEVAPDISPWLLKAVTNEGTTYEYLSTVMHIPCGRNVFYLARKKFYYELSKVI